MAESLNVIALISGGKDSFFSILHCLQNNHRVVALANLYPSSSHDVSDLNSYMYQTIGHAVIPAYADALDLPLYRRRIEGTAVSTKKDYEPALSSDSLADDETESLLLLLDEIKTSHPEANAVCSGAIESTYQRTRVESVAIRVGLVPLSYLWQYPRLPVPKPSSGGLLEDIAAVGIDARIVKVASGGLDEAFLWESLKCQDLRKKLTRSVAKYGGSVLGEGGEYETLVVDGPLSVWKRWLKIREEDRQIVQGEGGASWMFFKTAVTVGKRGHDQENNRWRQELKVPRLWDAAFWRLLSTQDEVIRFANEHSNAVIERIKSIPKWIPRQCVTTLSSMVTINNIIASGIGPDTYQQMLVIKANLEDVLKKQKQTPEDVVFTMVVLRSMEDFAAVNGVYNTLFNKSNPPARLTVACGDNLPPDINVMIHLRMDRGPRDSRDGLHVQSRSYWAPANIGPYSQAITVPFPNMGDSFAVYTAGQIPLVPASMQIYSGGTQQDPKSSLAIFWEQTCLALQHLWRVSRATRMSWWTYGIGFFVGESDEDISRKAMMTWLAWKTVHEPTLWGLEAQAQENDELDQWDRKYGGHGTFTGDKSELPLPAFEMLQPVDKFELGGDFNAAVPAFFAVQVDELPRGCTIEWHAPGLANTKVTMTTCCINGVELHHCYMLEHGITICTASLPAPMSKEIFAQKMEMMDIILQKYRPQQITIYTTRSMSTTAQTVPCRSIWGKDGRQLSTAMIIEVEGCCPNYRLARGVDLAAESH